jgi:hypothetical protein
MTITHRDMLNREVAPGDIVAYSQDNFLLIGRITKLTAHRVHITSLGPWNWTSQQRPETFIKLDDPAVTTWLLRGARTKLDILHPA